MPFLFPFPQPPALVVSCLPAPPLPGAETVSAYETWDADRLFQFGTNLLRSGRSFNRAIQVLEIAARKQPENSDYQLALGCAYVSRFASVSDAARQLEGFTFRTKNYPELKTAWAKAQKDPKNALFGTPAPSPPNPPTTPDDKRPFTLTPEQSKQELLRLGAQSLQSFEKARQNLANLPPDKQNESRMIYGWGLFTLRREASYQKILRETTPPPKTPKLPTTDNATPKVGKSDDVLLIDFSRAVESFRACSSAQPDNPAYAQSLGWSFVPDYLDGASGSWGSEMLYWEGGPHYTKNTLADAVAAFERALERRPRDFETLYSLAVVTAAFDYSASVGYLEKAAARQGINALLWYMASELRFRQAEKENNAVIKEGCEIKAVSAMEKGNTAAVFAPIKLPLRIPTWLRAAWKYHEAKGYGNDSRVLSNLYTRAGDYLEAQDAAKNTDAVLRGASALLGMGMKAARSVAADPDLDCSLSDLWQGNDGRATRAMCAYCDGIKAYQVMLNSQKTNPDDRKKQFLDSHKSDVDYLMNLDRQLFPR